MNYVKTIFITTILLSMGTFFNGQEYVAYTTEAPMIPAELPKPTTTDITSSLDELLLPQEIMPQEEVSPSQEWDKNLSTLGDHWDKATNIPTDEWKKKAFELAERVLEKNKSASETLRSSFIAAINTQTIEMMAPAIINLIKDFDDMISAKLSSLETQTSQEKKETPATEQSKPNLAEEVKQESIAESFPIPTENPLAPGATEGGTLSESANTPEQQAENKLLQEWDEKIASMRQGQGSLNEIDAMLYKINELAPQLVKAGKKTEPEIKKEFYDALEILGLKKHLPKSELLFRQDSFNRALSPEQYAAYDQEAQQSQQEAYEQSLAAEQERKLQEELKKFRQEMEAKEAIAQEKRDKSEKQIQAALALAKEQGRISEEKARNLEMRTRALTEDLAAKGVSGLETTINIKEKKARETFSKTIQQQTAAAKKLAEEKKAAAEQGIFSKAVKLVTDTASSLWYGTTPTTTSQALTQLEEQQELKSLEAYLASTTKGQDEIERIMKIWKKLQEVLRTVPQSSDTNNMDKWINTINILLRELVLTHHIISIEDACTKIKNALPLPSAGQDSRKEIVNKIKTYLNEAEWKIKTEKQQEEAKKMEFQKQKQEQKEQIRLVQQKIKDEEDRIKAEEKKQLAAASSYKDEKQQWKQLLAQLSQNKQATPEENNAQTLEAIKKSHSLFNLAKAIPAKNEHSVAQKLKQKFTVALLEQQKPNENKINIHHHMDQFNKAMNKLLE